MKATGTFDSVELRSLLEAAQTERATGTLQLSESGRSSVLYFLFGHLFHAVADSGNGETNAGDEAVMTALSWAGGEFSFDPKAKLPADDTVKSSISDLLARIDAGERPFMHLASAQPEETNLSSLIPVAGSPAPTMPTVTLFAPTSESIHSSYGTQPEVESRNGDAGYGSWPGPIEPGGWADAATVEQPPVQPTPTPEPEPVTQKDEPEPAIEFASNSDSEVRHGKSHQAKSVPPPQPKKSVKHRPEPKVAREPFPVPAGQLIYDSLKTSFVDFPRVISTLEKEGYTGYIRLLTDDSSGLIFFREGAALECVYDDGHTVARGKDALAALNDDVTRGSGVLDVVALSSELVAGLFDLTISEAVYTELYAGWVDIKGLISFLKDRNQTCVITARAQGVTGVVILTDGDLVGCYTSESRDISLELDPVLNLCQDPQTMIEVKSTVEGVHPKLNVAEIMGSKRPTITAAPTPAAPPPALASPPAPPTPLPSMAPSFATPPPSEQIRTPFPEPAAAPGFSPVPAFNPPSYGSGSPLGQTQPIPFVSATPTPAPTGPAPALPTAWNPGIPGGSGFPTPQAPSRSADSHGGTDWERVIDNLQMLAEESLGNRSRKVKDILAAAERSPAGVADAINQIPSISLLFVDSSRLEALAGEMRGRVQGLV